MTNDSAPSYIHTDQKHHEHADAAHARERAKRRAQRERQALQVGYDLQPVPLTVHHHGRYGL